MVLNPGCFLELLSGFCINTEVWVPYQTNYFRLSDNGAWTLEAFQSSVGGSNREPKLKSIEKEVIFYSKYDDKPLTDSKQGNDIIKFTFLKGNSHYFSETGLWNAT